MMDDVSLIFPKNVKDKKEFYLYHFFFFCIHVCSFHKCTIILNFIAFYITVFTFKIENQSSSLISNSNLLELYTYIKFIEINYYIHRIIYIY